MKKGASAPNFFSICPKITVAIGNNVVYGHIHQQGRTQMTNEVKVAQNIAILCKAGIEALLAAGMTEQQIVAKMPEIVADAIAFLKAKGA